MTSSEKISSVESKSIPDDEDWWENFVTEEYPTEKCLQYFKCSRKTYFYLIENLKLHVSPKIGLHPDASIYLCKGVCVEKQIAILLFKLTSAADYTLITKKFKVHKTTIHKIIYKCINAINKFLLKELIRMPKSSEAQKVANDFENIYQLPQIIGVMSIVHIPVSSPINLNHQFLNSKLYSSFILQCIIDSNFYFRDVSVRHAGAVEPHLILGDSHINKFWEKILPKEKRDLGGICVPYKIVGSKSGPLNLWLLNDYKSASSTKELSFNNYLNEMRNFADSVILRLRSRFMILSKLIEISYKVSPQLIAACCVIHNICEKESDPILIDWINECEENLKKYPQPEDTVEWDVPDEKILKERDALKDYIDDQITEIYLHSL